MAGSHVVAERTASNSYTLTLETGEVLPFHVALVYFKDAQGETKATNPTHNYMWAKMLEYSNDR